MRFPFLNYAFISLKEKSHHGNLYCRLPVILIDGDVSMKHIQYAKVWFNLHAVVNYLCKESCYTSTYVDKNRSNFLQFGSFFWRKFISRPLDDLNSDLDPGRWRREAWRRARADLRCVHWVRPHPRRNTKYLIVYNFFLYSHPPGPNVCTHSPAGKSP